MLAKGVHTGSTRMTPNPRLPESCSNPTRLFIGSNTQELSPLAFSGRAFLRVTNYNADVQVGAVSLTLKQPGSFGEAVNVALGEDSSSMMPLSVNLWLMTGSLDTGDTGESIERLQ